MLADITTRAHMYTHMHTNYTHAPYSHRYVVVEGWVPTNQVVDNTTVPAIPRIGVQCCTANPQWEALTGRHPCDVEGLIDINFVQRLVNRSITDPLERCALADLDLDLDLDLDFDLDINLDLDFDLDLDLGP
jgi:hypothetical protein